MINLKISYSKNWLFVLGAICLMAFLNMNPAIHNVIINIDTRVAIRANSITGINPNFDMMLAWLCTRTGDAFMLFSICSLLFIHSLKGPDLDETIRRLSFWFWTGALCLLTYLLSSACECFLKRDTPILTLHQFRNLQTICGLTFHSCPTSSFPSGHGLAYIFFAMMAWRRYFRTSLLLWCLAIIMLSVRLIVGLHWLSDIILGSLFLSLLLVSLVDGTPLKNSYKLVQQTVSFLVGSVILVKEKYLTDR